MGVKVGPRFGGYVPVSSLTRWEMIRHACEDLRTIPVSRGAPLPESFTRIISSEGVEHPPSLDRPIKATASITASPLFY